MKGVDQVGYKKVGLIGAMAEEIALFEQQLERSSETVVAGIRFLEGTLCGKSVVLCRSGVGKVNAAMTTQILIDRFGTEAILFTGVAGAVDPELGVGHIVISDRCVQHDMDVTALGFPKGVIPYQELTEFRADGGLKELAYGVSTELFPGEVKVGDILSGDQFIADPAKVARLYEEFRGACVEMEGAAVAQVCALNGIPFVIVRCMSDKADGSAGVDFGEFVQMAANRSIQIVHRLLKQI